MLVCYLRQAKNHRRGRERDSVIGKVRIVFVIASLMSYENNHRRQDCPTGELLRVLEHITQRVEKEMTEERSGMVASTTCEPIFD